MFDTFRLIAHLLLGLNFILFFLKFLNGNKAYKIFTFYLGLIILIEATIMIVVKLGYQNLIFSHVYFTGQFIFLSFFYLQLLTGKYQTKIVMINLMLIPLILAVNFLINPTQLHEFSMLEIILTSIPIMGYSVFHFYNMLSNKKEFYYINCGILIYLFGSTVSFLPRNLHVIYGYSFSMSLQVLNIVLYNVYLLFILIEWLNINSKVKNEIRE
jgi:hypothetical protein